MKKTLTSILALSMLLSSTPRIAARSEAVAAADTISNASAACLSRPTSIDSVMHAAMQPLELPGYTPATPDSVRPIEVNPAILKGYSHSKGSVISIYDLPYSMTRSSHDWRRLWINTGVLTGAFVGTLLVLECLPEDATTWNRAALQKIPLFTRWRQHVIEQGPEWDHDKFIFNYVLHPYAGAVYFMSARSVGFNFWQSLLYSTIISDVGWEYGIEAFMERPSYQDLFITPLVGSAIGEGFYRLKRHLVDNDYRLFGSPVVGNIVAFLIDPVNEVVGLFDHNPARRVARARKAQKEGGMSFVPMLTPGYAGFSLVATF